MIFNSKTPKAVKPNDKNLKSIEDYTPSGKLLYNQDLLKKIENKVLK